jgi:hypothetical protein
MNVRDITQLCHAKLDMSILGPITRDVFIFSWMMPHGTVVDTINRCRRLLPKNKLMGGTSPVCASSTGTRCEVSHIIGQATSPLEFLSFVDFGPLFLIFYVFLCFDTW